MPTDEDNDEKEKKNQLARNGDAREGTRKRGVGDEQEDPRDVGRT